MPLTNPAARRLVHTRTIECRGYEREDGLWDIEAHLTDIKNHDYELKTGVRRAGQPVHSMWVRITIDRRMKLAALVAARRACLPRPSWSAIFIKAFAIIAARTPELRMQGNATVVWVFGL